MDGGGGGGGGSETKATLQEFWTMEDKGTREREELPSELKEEE